MTALLGAMSVNAQNKAALYDSTQVEQLQEVVVKGVRAQKNAPYAVTNMKKQQLDAFSKTGRELPLLFSQTPGILAWSDNGLGTGTTAMRIRGAGGSRINVTLDGVPLNSPEDQCVFWANMNSYGSPNMKLIGTTIIYTIQLGNHVFWNFNIIHYVFPLTIHMRSVLLSLVMC